MGEKRGRSFGERKIIRNKMKKIFRILILIIFVGFVIIQFFQPEKNSGEISANHLFEKEQIPENIESILKVACLDCHSNKTNYLWYHNVAPISWMVNKHVIAGKEELNLSHWGELGVLYKITALEDICQEAERKIMPLKEYTLLHKEAKLTDEQIAELCDWTEKLGLELLAAIEK